MSAGINAKNSFTQLVLNRSKVFALSGGKIGEVKTLRINDLAHVGGGHHKPRANAIERQSAAKVFGEAFPFLAPGLSMNTHASDENNSGNNAHHKNSNLVKSHNGQGFWFPNYQENHNHSKRIMYAGLIAFFIAAAAGATALIHMARVL